MSRTPRSDPSRPLARHLRRRIAREGPLTVAAFMEEALAHPRFGYYTTRDPLGVAGDFTTAPEISQMFGELIGAWCAATWQALGRPDPVFLVELGPGRGTLMADLLRATRAVPGFARAVRPHLVEISPALRARQQTALATVSVGAPPAWHESLATVPQGPLLVVANEYFDALPIRQFQKSAGAWRERLVDVTAGGKFRFVLSAPLAHDAPVPPMPRGAPEGGVVEVGPAALDVVRVLAGRIVRDRGAALVIDYGHAEGAAGDTLQAVKDHAYHDILDRPGEADLTAHVDFAALARVARAAGATVFGPVSQGVFLDRLGVGVRARALQAKATPEQAADIAAALRRLTDPDAMGALFKAMAIAAPNTAIGGGFEG